MDRFRCEEMKQMQEMKYSARQRIIETQANILSKRFCDTMNIYYQSVVAYDKRCRAKVTRQAEIGAIISVNWIIFAERRSSSVLSWYRDER